MDLLLRKGAEVQYNDPHIPRIRPVRSYSFDLESTPLTEALLEATDCVLLATNHSAYDYDFIQSHASLIVDTRNAFTGKPGLEGKVVWA